MCYAGPHLRKYAIARVALAGANTEQSLRFVVIAAFTHLWKRSRFSFQTEVVVQVVSEAHAEPTILVRFLSNIQGGVMKTDFILRILFLRTGARGADEQETYRDPFQDP